MARRQFRFPVWQRLVGREAVYEWLVPFEIRTETGGYAPLTFLVDTGSHLTTIPIPEAERLRIPFDRGRPIGIRGATGSGTGYLGRVWFSLATLPEFVFESYCCFSPTLDRSLLSLKDLLAHFRLRTLLPSRRGHPLGSLVLQLHGKHKGQTRGVPAG